MVVDGVVVYLLLGVFAGFVAGLLGVGGGLVIVPVLVWVFVAQGMAAEVVMQMALGTSLATIAVTSIAAVRAHHKRGAVVWPLVGRLVPGLVVGALLGAWLAHGFSREGLQGLFGVFAVAVALYLFWGAPGPVGERWCSPSAQELGVVSAAIGLLSSLLGIGGGTLTVPYLSWRGLVIQRAVAVSAACGLPIALGGSLGYLLAGWQVAQLPPLSSGYLYWPAFFGIASMSLLFAPVGAAVAHRLPVRTLKRVFSLLLFCVGIAMLVL